MESKRRFFTDDKNINRLLGKSNSPCNPLTNSTLKNSIEWYIKKDSKMIYLIEQIENIIKVTNQIINFNNLNDTEDSLDDITRDNILYIKKLEDYLNTLQYRKDNTLKDIDRKLRRAIDEGYENNWVALLDSINKSKDMLDKSLEVFQDKVETSMLLFIKSLDFYKSYRGKFFTEKKTDIFFYLFSLINVFIRYTLLKTNPQHPEPMKLIDDSLITNCLIDLNNRLQKAEVYLNNRPLKDLQYGGSKIIDAQLIQILLK